MKRLLTLVPVTLLMLACGGASTGTPDPTHGPTGAASVTPGGDPVSCAPGGSGGDASVAIVDFGFQPATSSVSAGQTVTFNNTGQAPHTITFDDGPDCGRVLAGGSMNVTFTLAGTYAYHCDIHPEMKATITVNE